MNFPKIELNITLNIILHNKLINENLLQLLFKLCFEKFHYDNLILLKKCYLISA